MVRASVEVDKASVVVIDSLNGFLNAMAEERAMLLQLHELLAYLAHQGVVTIMVVAQHGLVASMMDTPIDISYLADTVLLLRYFEHQGKVRQALSAKKKRQSGHERSIREMRMTSKGLSVGEPLTQFDGVLTGVPVYSGDKPMIKESE
jgi:circadian clock protein KaiC